MPVPPAELSARYTIEGPEGGARAVAEQSGIAHEAGPGETMLAGSRAQVLGTLGDVVTAALAEGAYRIDVRLEAPAGSR